MVNKNEQDFITRSISKNGSAEDKDETRGQTRISIMMNLNLPPDSPPISVSLDCKVEGSRQSKQ